MNYRLRDAAVVIAILSGMGAATLPLQGAVAAPDARFARVYLGNSEMSVRNLLGEGIYSPKGERIARVDDLYLDNGKVRSLIFVSGDILGLGGKKGALDFGRVSIVTDSDNDPNVRVSFSQAALDAVAPYRTDDDNNYNLASEIIGTDLALSQSRESARVKDIVINSGGEVRYLIVRGNDLDPADGDAYAVDIRALVKNQSGQGLALRLTPQALREAPKFDYERLRKQASGSR